MVSRHLAVAKVIDVTGRLIYGLVLQVAHICIYLYNVDNEPRCADSGSDRSEKTEARWVLGENVLFGSDLSVWNLHLCLCLCGFPLKIRHADSANGT